MSASDPLQNVADRQRQLFDNIVKVASGFSTEDVAGAALNLLVNALRQAHGSRHAAFEGLDRLHASSRELLASHYDAMGKRRNVFPFHQVIDVPHFDARKNGKF